MANLKLKNPSGGSLNLVSADGASDLTVTFPATTGTAMVSGNMPAFSAYMSTNPVCLHDTYTKMPFNTEQFDTNNCFDSTTNYRFTPTTAGYYQIYSQLQSGGASGRQYDNALYIYKNGSSVQRMEISASMGTGQQLTYMINGLISMNGSTDYLEIYYYVYDYTASSSATVYGSNSRFQAFLARTT